MKIIPQPMSVKMSGGSFGFWESLVFDNDCFEAKCLSVYLNSLNIKTAFGKNANIFFELDDRQNKEAYSVSIKEDKIEVKAASHAGFFYATQTLKQIFCEYGRVLPCCEIIDEPRFAFRSFMLDNGRYFYSCDDVKKMIDIAALHKYNVFHWHLTEDQGWRIEIDKYPLLTKVGSKRAHTNFNIFKSHGGFYTKEQIKEIVNYAHQRHMSVMPEIDMPGHMRAAIAAYPELTCFERKLSVATHFGVKHDILCAGKPQVYDFVFDVLKEVFELFDDEYIHLGGDEAVKHRWRLCPNCRKVIEDNKLKGGAEQLQAYFLDKVADFCVKNGKIPMIWYYENANHIKNKSTVFEYYSGNAALGGDTLTSGILAEIEGGRRVLNATSSANYLDLPYGTISLKNAFCYESDLTGDLNKNLIGTEACLWTEYVPNLKSAEVKTLPRLAALAENCWSKDKQDYDSFLKKIDAYYRLLKSCGYKAATLKRALPSRLRGQWQKLWFGRRVLHWQGLYNLIDDAAIARRAKKESK